MEATTLLSITMILLAVLVIILIIFNIITLILINISSIKYEGVSTGLLIFKIIILSIIALYLGS